MTSFAREEQRENMKKIKTIHFITILLFPLLNSCGLLGIHMKVNNPKSPGKIPKFSEETILHGELTKYRSCFDVHYYDLNIKFHPEEKNIEGKVEIHAIAQFDFDTLQLDLHSDLKITSLTENDNLQFSRKERAIFIPLKKKKGDQFVIKVSYEGSPIIAKKPPWVGGLVWKKDKEGNHWDGVACESIGASIWWPLKDHTSDEPDSMRLHYTVPKGLTAVGNGQLENSTNTEKTSTFNWFVSYPINTYNVTFYIGKFKLINDTYIGINGKELALNHYVLEPNYEKAKKHFQQLHDQLKLYEKIFGEYPWYRDGFKLVESPYAGMEHQSAIAYGNGYKNDLDSATDYIILHETAHEWWGNSVTAKDMNDVWLHEGFATYSEALYLEDAKGFNNYMNHLMFNRIFIKNKYPVVGIKDRRWFHHRKGSDVYVKGAWILHTLRTQINDDVIFFDILKTFATRYRHQIVESKDFINLVNEKTNEDYNWFFNQYLYNRSAPEFEYYASYAGNFFYRWGGNTNKGFNKLNIKLKTSNKTIILTPSSKVQEIALPRNKEGYWNFRISQDVLYEFSKNNKLIEYYENQK